MLYEKWLTHEFSTGTEPGEDYVDFQKDMKKDLIVTLQNNQMKIYQFNKNHYCFSAVVTDIQEQFFVFVSLSDVRGQAGAWSRNVLVRSMKDKEDWTGGRNQYCHWHMIGKSVRGIINSMMLEENKHMNKTSIELEKVKKLREEIKKGDHVAIVNTKSEEMKKYINDQMCVDHIDDMGTIHGSWQMNGGSLGVVPEVDTFEKLLCIKVLGMENTIEKDYNNASIDIRGNNIIEMMQSYVRRMSSDNKDIAYATFVQLLHESSSPMKYSKELIVMIDDDAYIFGNDREVFKLDKIYGDTEIKGEVKEETIYAVTPKLVKDGRER